MKLYDAANDDAKKWLNQAVFEHFEIDMIDEAGQPAEQAAAENETLADGILSNIAAAVFGGSSARGGEARTAASLTATGGSNVTHLAETEGLEPSVPRRGLRLARSTYAHQARLSGLLSTPNLPKHSIIWFAGTL